MKGMPNKFFNLLIPYEQYKKLKDLSRERDLPMADFIRSGIDYVLLNSKVETKN